MNTIVINLFAGPGAGKSTLAASLFADMKLMKLNVELVTEYVKGWAWEKRVPGLYDQVYIFGKQTHAESRLYGKVNYIVTDSPFLLSPIYEMIHNGTSVTDEAAMKFLRLSHDNGVTHVNFLVTRYTPYMQSGRFEPEGKARLIDKYIENYLINSAIPYQKITGDISELKTAIKHNLYLEGPCEDKS